MSEPTTTGNASEAVSEAPAEPTVIVENADGTLSDVPVSQLEAKPEESETDDPEVDDEGNVIDSTYWKHRSRKNETAKNKALNENKVLLAENATLKSELNSIKHEINVSSVITEFGLNDMARQFLTSDNLDGLKEQAKNLVAFSGGKVPATPTPVPAPVVEAEQPKFINPLQAQAPQEVVAPKSFGELILEAGSKF